MSFDVTPAHQAIFDAIKAGDRNIVISAVAGAGKTSTIVEALRLIPEDRQVLFLAFNKRIVEELVKRVPKHVQVKTLNALGHNALTNHLVSRGVMSVKLDAGKVRALAKDAFSSDAERYRYLGAVTKLVRLAKSAGIVPDGIGLPGLLPDAPESWAWLIEHHDIDLGEKADPGLVVDVARATLLASCQMLSTIDYDDQLLLTYALEAPVPVVDWVFVDEAQDLSPLQHALVRRCIGDRGRLVAVGDENQAIYGFRGADAASMDTLAAAFQCERLPLHVSYRCPQRVVEAAQKYVGHIQAHASAPEGVVEEKPLRVEEAKLKGGDMVVCRKSAPVVRTAFQLLRSGTPAVILGRDIGQGLITLVENLQARNLDDLRTRLDQWEAKEVEKAIKKDDEAKQAAIVDRADTIRVFIDMATTLDDVRANIERMFSDDNPANVVTCCTIHKSKGLEAERVFIVNVHEMPSKWAKKPWQMQQERNLAYVAFTRAKAHLGFLLVGNDNGDKVVVPRASPGAAQESAEWVPVHGDTFPVKDQLKAMGARFNFLPDHPKKWCVPASKLDEAQAIVKGSGRSSYARRYR